MRKLTCECEQISLKSWLKGNDNDTEKAAFMHPEQKRICKSMTPDRKFAIANELYRAARRARQAWLPSLHPDWTGEQISRTLREIFLHAGT